MSYATIEPELTVEDLGMSWEDEQELNRQVLKEFLLLESIELIGEDTD